MEGWTKVDVASRDSHFDTSSQAHHVPVATIRVAMRRNKITKYVRQNGVEYSKNVEK